MTVTDDVTGTDSVVELEFATSDSRLPCVAATEAEECVLELAELFPRSDGEYAEFFHVTGISPERVLDFTGAYQTIDATLLCEYEVGALFEFATTGDCPAYALAELGALPREATSVDGEARIVAELPPQFAPSPVVDEFLDGRPDARLVSKQERENFSPFFSQSSLEQLLHEHLTDRQREVLRAAFDAGYYEWPREASGTDVASTLGISSATFSEHIHAAERNLLTALFDR